MPDVQGVMEMMKISLSRLLYRLNIVFVFNLSRVGVKAMFIISTIPWVMRAKVKMVKMYSVYPLSRDLSWGLGSIQRTPCAMCALIAQIVTPFVRK